MDPGPTALDRVVHATGHLRKATLWRDDGDRQGSGAVQPQYETIVDELVSITAAEDHIDPACDAITRASSQQAASERCVEA